MKSPQTDDVLILLIDLWQRRIAELPGYFQSVFGLDSVEYMPTTLHISLQNDGSIHPENIGHSCSRAWLIKEAQATEIPINHEWQRRYDIVPTGRFFIKPSWLVVHEGTEILLSERYGENLKHRSIGQISLVNEQWQISWNTLWHTDPY